jgi:hypothetical protein
MDADDDMDRFLTEEEEKRLGEGLRKAYATCNPNPERIGCPDQKLIRDLAFHKKVGRKLFEKATIHMSECSECVKDALRYVEEYKKQAKKK